MSPTRGPRDVNLQVVKTKDAYRFVLFYDFGEEDFDIVWCTLPINHEKLMSLIQGVRKDVISVVKKEGTLADGTRGFIFYDGEPEVEALEERRLPKMLRVDDDIYTHALKILAEAGSNRAG